MPPSNLSRHAPESIELSPLRSNGIRNDSAGHITAPEALPTIQPATGTQSGEKQDLGLRETGPVDADDDSSLKPSEDELKSLRRVSGKMTKSIASIILYELIENCTFHGTFVVLTNLVQQPLPPGSTTGAGREGQSGALGMGQRASTGVALGRAFFFCCTPLLGAFVTDQYLGRYNAIQYGNAVMLSGRVLIIVAAIPAVIAKANMALGILITGTFVVGIGYGGCRPNLTTLLQDQVPDALEVSINHKGDRVMVDPAVTRTRALLYNAMFANLGAMAGMTATVYAEKYVGFWLSFSAPTILFMVCPFILFFNRKSYVRIPPSSFVLGKAWKLCVLALRNCWSWNPRTMHRNMQREDFWDRVKPSRIADRPHWMTFDDSWVDEVARGVRACRVLLWFPLYWPALRQMHSNLTSQAATLSLGFLPNDLLGNINTLAVVILVPIWVHLIYPALERRGIRFTPIRRISVGFLNSAVAIAAAAIGQHFVYKTHPCQTSANSCVKEGRVSPLPFWIQLPSYVILANSEILAPTTAMEYVYSQAPKNMRSLVMAAFILTLAGGSVLGQALIPLSEDPYLVWNYTVIAALSLIASVGVWWSNRKVDENYIKEKRGDL